jgi:phospholipid/cholesterol/gamma-HCH transport system permease protein
MKPLLHLYADFVGILGGATVGAGMLGLTLRSHLLLIIMAISLTALVGGLVKNSFYGLLSAIAGCFTRTFNAKTVLGS